MKTLDKYILSAFLKNYLISFGVLIGLYVVLDMVVNFDELSGQKTGAGGGVEGMVATITAIADYYFYQVFVIFTQLSGVIPVVAAAFTLVRLNRNNELTAMMAAGVPLMRVAAPIIVCAVVLNVILLPVNQELVVPNIVHKLQRKRNDLHREGAKSFSVLLPDNQGRWVIVPRYTPGFGRTPPKMDELHIVEPDEQARPVALIQAKSATWNEATGRWDLVGGTITTGLRPGERRSEPKPLETYDSDITPKEIMLARSGQYVDLLSTNEINQLLEKPQIYGVRDLLRVKHARWAALLLNIVLVLLAVGAIMSREVGNIRQRAMVCFMLVGGCMGTVFLCQHLAGTPPPGGGQLAANWPAILAFAPVFLFGPIAVWKLDRVKT
jgi:lipopolysaccharide export LptBFGC system permease protein LptF